MSTAGWGIRASQRLRIASSCPALGSRQVFSPVAQAWPKVWITGTIIERGNPARSAWVTIVSMACRWQVELSVRQG
ncbi:hypothetical protein FHU30_006556 [Actinomadura rupiterrae]|nr:hypothetical protein [Actinomadura rupiterrae]